MMRQLAPAEMDMYRLRFQEPQHRKLIWRFANELPIDGTPSDVTKAVEQYGRWLKKSPIPKLLIYGEPGAITSQQDVKWARKELPNLEAVSVGAGRTSFKKTTPPA